MAKKIRTIEVNIGPESHGSRYHLRMGKALWRWLTVEELVDVSSALNGELSRVLRERGEEMNDGERVDGLEKQGEQKHMDKVEPKFKVGDWIIENGVNRNPVQITSFEEDKGVGIKVWFSNGTETYIDFLKGYHKWTIQDAKDGDVLCYETKNELRIFIYKNGHVHYHCCYYNGHLTTVDSYFIVEKYLLCYIQPATKEQRDLLFAKMKEAGYEWDAEKKELRKIEQTPVIIIPKFKVGDKIYAIKNRFECTIESIDETTYYGDTTNFDIKDQDNWELVEQNLAWSEEDEHTLQGVIDEIQANKNQAPDYDFETYDRFLSWLKSLKQRYTWKPSDEQIKALKETCDEHWEPDGLDPLYTLWEQLKKLKGE